MVEISHRERVVRAKIIYYGPAAGGKTTNLVVLHRRAAPDRRGEMVSVNSTQDRTILLDLLPMKTPAFRGYELRFQVIAVPGQRMYAASRKLLLNGADAVVFVANSATDRWEETIQSLREMNQYLLAHGLDPATIPMTLQYNKRDLPDVTPLDAMDRTLNARKTASFPAVSIREEGVLETFHAALRGTMEDIATRFKLGGASKNARSVEEWTADSMRAIFDWSPSSQTDEPVPRPEASSGPPAGKLLNRVAVKVPVARSIEGGPPSAATPATDPQAAEALVDSYAQAAVDLTSALEDMRDRRDAVEQRLADIDAPMEATLAVIGGASPDDVLKTLVMRIADTLSAMSGSLSLTRDDVLEPVVLHGLQREPLFSSTDGSAPIASTFLDATTPLVYTQGDPGPLGPVLDRSGGRVTAIVVIPIRNPIQTLGLACFYFPPDVAAPSGDALEHLERLGSGVAVLLEVAAGRYARSRLSRMERVALVGRLAEQAILEMGPPVDRLFATLGRLRTEDLPERWSTELGALGLDLTRAKRYRDAVLGFMVGQPPPLDLIPLGPVFHGVRAWTRDSLERHAVTLETTEPDPNERVRADAFLLRSAIAAIVERSEHDLRGHGGGRIQISSRVEGDKAYIRVADNVSAVKTTREGGHIAKSLDNGALAWPLPLVHNVVRYFQGDWSAGSTDEGNELTLVLRAS